MPALSAWSAVKHERFPKLFPYESLALTEGLGFSFRYDGKKVGPARPEGWQVSSEDDGRRTWFRHPSGLAVQRSVRVFPEFEAVEYTLRFKNEGQSPLPLLEDVNALDLTFAGDSVKGVSVLTCGGGGADATFPPKDFALTQTSLGGAASQDQVTLQSRNGLPSGINLPFFYVQNREQTDGVFAGIGWSGDWQATIRAKHGTDALDLRGGMRNIRLKL
jgi:alpha-galactosidase